MHEGGPYEATHFHTFLSYNSMDRVAVEQLAQQLHRKGIDLWLDTWNLIPGNPWQVEIEHTLA